MKRLFQFVLLTLAAGCATVTDSTNSAPPMPPVPTHHFAPVRIMAASAAAVVSAAKRPAPLLVDPGDVIEISRCYAFLSWTTNDLNRALVLWTPDLNQPVEMWRIPGSTGYLINPRNNRVYFAFTNLVDQAFFRLVRVPTNTLGVSWTYDFTTNAAIDSFVVRFGDKPGVYDRTNVAGGKCQWTTIEVPNMNTAWYLTVSARDSNNVESAVSEPVVWYPAQ